MMQTVEETLALWLRYMKTADTGLLPSLLADDPVLRTPVYWQERKGAEVSLLLSCVPDALGPITYLRQWIGGRDWALEFSGEVEGIPFKGVNLMTLDETNRIRLLEVMLRPPEAGAAFLARMQARVAKARAAMDGGKGCAS